MKRLSNRLIGRNAACNNQLTASCFVIEPVKCAFGAGDKAVGYRLLKGGCEIGN
jgi:hypothetical protein